jgi:hypothetical protein
MLKEFHIEICQRALKPHFSSRALKVIIQANLKQDHIRYQLKHPHFHFDSNAFEESYAFIDQQRQIILDSLRSTAEPKISWEAFGRLTHTVQDFYAHSNYVQLWIDANQDRDILSPEQIQPMDSEIINHPNLHSGKVYFLDWLAYVPGFYRLASRFSPKDSHTNMNLDHPGRGSLFPLAMEAAVKCTAFEFKRIADILDPSTLNQFKDC